MGLISRVGRKSYTVKSITLFMYVLLIVGAITMVYPFLLMLSSSITSSVDYTEFRLIPRYLYSAKALYQKFIADKYNGNIEVLNNVYCSDYFQFNEVYPLKIDTSSVGILHRVNDWYEFINLLPIEYKQIGYLGYGGVETGETQYLFQHFLKNKYKNVSVLKKNTSRT